MCSWHKLLYFSQCDCEVAREFPLSIWPRWGRGLGHSKLMYFSECVPWVFDPKEGVGASGGLVPSCSWHKLLYFSKCDYEGDHRGQVSAPVYLAKDGGEVWGIANVNG